MTLVRNRSTTGDCRAYVNDGTAQLHRQQRHTEAMCYDRFTMGCLSCKGSCATDAVDDKSGN
eukprot:4799940-Pleurochrysis_carterae.AAC.8